MKQLEHTEQVLLMQWWALNHKLFGVPEQLLFAIPNGGQRNIITAAKLKCEGVRPGIPDLFLAYPAGEYCGLFIEMKRENGGVVSEYQENCINIFNKCGYRAIICHGWLDAKSAIVSYLKSRIY